MLMQSEYSICRKMRKRDDRIEMLKAELKKQIKLESEFQEFQTKNKIKMQLQERLKLTQNEVVTD